MDETRDGRCADSVLARVLRFWPVLACVGLAACMSCGPAGRPASAAADPTTEWRWTNIVDNKKLPLLDEPRWESAGDLMLRDQATGLEWAIPSKMTVQGDVSFEQAEQYCQGIFPGTRSWHVPTRQQLLTLADYKYSNPMAGTDVLTGLRPAFYWTSTLYDPANSDKALWAINFGNGVHAAYLPKRTAGVLCVMQHEWPPVAHYTDRGTTIDDNATGLSWHKQTTHVDMNSENLPVAMANACAASTLAGKRWRVPTQAELSSLLNAGYSKPYLDPLFAGESFLLSSTGALPGNGQTVHAVNFYSGVLVQESGYDTRCVSQWSGNTSTDRIYRGSVYISNATDLQKFAAGQYRRVEGSLAINLGVKPGPDTDVGAVVLPYLEEVTGSIGIGGNPKIRTVAMPSLVTIGGALELSTNAALEQVVFPQLTSIGGDLTLDSNPLLGRNQPSDDDGREIAPLDFRALASVGGNVQVMRNKVLRAFAINRLLTVGKLLAVEQNQNLWSFRFMSLQSTGAKCKGHDDFCGDFRLALNAVLQNAALPMLQRVGYTLTINGNPKLDGVSQRINGIGGGMSVTFNAALCEKHLTDPILTRSWDSRLFPSPIAIANNKQDADCRSICPSDTMCKIPH